MRIKIHYKITFVFTLIMALVMAGVFVFLNNALRTYTYQLIRRDLLQKTSLARVYVQEALAGDCLLIK